MPQLIYITFDDAVNDENWKLYQDRIFPEKYKNPNGCPIHGTFYVSHEYTNYAMVNKLWNQGHEISVHSITHRTPESWWEGKKTLENTDLGSLNETLTMWKFNNFLATQILCEIYFGNF